MIGVFDSGLGGLSVLREIREAMPRADLLYVADRGRAPYGSRSMEEVRGFSADVAEWLIDRGCDTVVVACNTASAAALDLLRATHVGIPIIGMEPAVKPAAAVTNTGVIAVFATATTFQGRLYESVVSRFRNGARIIARACPQWVEAVEAGLVDGDEVEEMIGSEVRPVVDEGADMLVLGCTHFSFLSEPMSRVAGPDVSIVDPAPAVAAQTARRAVSTEGSGRTVLAASGDITTFGDLAARVAGVRATTPTLRFP